MTPLLALMAALMPAVQDNALTDDEKKDGWKLLFDGTTLDGWKGYRQPEAPDGWAAENGCLTWTKSAGDLVTKEKFSDFELSIDWRVAPGGNSGILYRVAESEDKPWKTGLEYQVLDDAAHKDGKKPETSAGALYAVYAPSKNVVKPGGEWNSARIRVQGSKVEHWLNGEKIVDAEIGSDDWKERIARSKWAKVPTYAGQSEGHLSLQDHGDKVEYRNIKIRTVVGNR